MTYDELQSLLDRAWYEFFMVFSDAGVDADALEESMDRRDCFNDVTDAVHAVVKLEPLEDEE